MCKLKLLSILVHTDNNRPDGYVPPRQGWTDQGQAGRSLPLRSGSRAQGAISPHSPTHRRRSSGDHYYDDVEPRFAEPLHPTPELQAIPPSHIPPALTPGYTAPLANPSTSTVQRDPTHYLQPSSSNPALNHSNSYEDIQEGSRSPAESDRSNFTSVSQRGVNPRWNPAMGPGGFGAPMNNRRPVPPPTQRNEILLNSNPDFELPGARPGRGPSREAGQRRPLPGGMVPRSAYDGGTAM
jgi:hypothetical protein